MGRRLSRLLCRVGRHAFLRGRARLACQAPCPALRPWGRGEGATAATAAGCAPSGPLPPPASMPGLVALPPVPPRGPRGRSAPERLPGLECVLLGDGAVGKTSLALSYSANGFPARYLPTALDRFSAVVEVDGAPLRLQLCDTAGQDELDGLRRLCYRRAEVFLLCFSVVAPASFANLSAKWLPELRRHCPGTPVLLVGTQADLRHDVQVLIALARRRQKPVPAAAARALAGKLGTVGYVECSALTQHNLKEVFDTAIAAALRRAQPPPKARAAARFRTLSKAWWRKYGCLRR